jgi:hypothetical protein
LKVAGRTGDDVAMVTLLAIALAAAPASAELPCGEAKCVTFSTPAAAFEKVLERAPVILAIGEYHETEGMPKVKSAIKRFTLSMVPLLKGRAASLVAETWITTGKCGEVEKQAVAEVKKVTQRPDTTESEIETMLGASYKLGIHNHILSLDCDEYRSMVGADGELDAEKSLRMMREKVQEKALELREKDEAGTAGKLLVLYGGALHNDLYPADDWKDYSFGPKLSGMVKGSYVELDLLVSQYVEKDTDLLAQSWFAPALALAKKGKTVLVAPKPNSYVLLFAR